MERLEVFLENNTGEIRLFVDDRKAGLMAVSIADDKLTVYHTEVGQEYEGKGYAQKLLERLVSHARANNLQIVPLCAYVHTLFRRHPDEYHDIWYQHNP